MRIRCRANEPGHARQERRKAKRYGLRCKSPSSRPFEQAIQAKQAKRKPFREKQTRLRECTNCIATNLDIHIVQGPTPRPVHDMLRNKSNKSVCVFVSVRVLGIECYFVWEREWSWHWAWAWEWVWVWVRVTNFDRNHDLLLRHVVTLGYAHANPNTIPILNPNPIHHTR